MADCVTPIPSGPLSLPGAQLEIVTPIGRIGDGIVYEALLDGRRARLREYAPEGIVRRRDDGVLEPAEPRFADAWAQGRARFAAQARALAALDHPSLPRLCAPLPSAVDGAPLLVSQSPGAPLAAQLVPGTALPSGQVMHIAAELAAALAALHRAGLTHLDLAPDTVSIERGIVQLSDFAVDNRSFMALLGSQEGLVRPGYSPLERYDAAAADALGPATDIFGASALLYRLIEGGDPAPWQDRFRDPSLAALPDRPAYPPAFLAAIRQGLAIEPRDRPADGAAWQAALAPPAARPSPPVFHPAGQPLPTRPMPAANWLIPLIVTLLLVLLAGFAYLAYTQRWFAGPDPIATPGNAPLSAPIPAPEPAPAEPPLIAAGSTVAGRLTTADTRGAGGRYQDRFTIVAQAGDRLEISLSSPDFDPVLRVTGPGLDASNDDDSDAGSRDSRLIATFPRAGRYILEVSSYDRGATGSYLLQIARAAAEPIDDDVVTLDQSVAAQLAGRWRSEDDDACDKPAANAVTGDRLTSRVGDETFVHRLVETRGGDIRTIVTDGPLEGREFTFRLSPDGDSYEIEGERWERWERC